MEFTEQSIKVMGEMFCTMKKKGIPLWSHNQKNQIVTGGLYILAAHLANYGDNYNITKLGFGTGTTAPTSSDASLKGQHFRVGDFVDDGRTTTDGINKALIYWTVDYNADIENQIFQVQGGGSYTWPVGTSFTIEELGLFSTAGAIFNRIVWTGPDLIMDTDMVLDGYFKLTMSI